MIEIQAKLLRGPVYFCEETIECLVTLRNVPQQNQPNYQLQSLTPLPKEPSTTEESSTGASVCNGETTEANGSLEKTRVPQLPVERLCWANVQLHCFCLVDESQVNEEQIAELSLGPNSHSNGSSRNSSFSSKRSSIALETYASNDTSFHECLLRAERGTIVYASAPKILFCDLQLAPWECQTFVYTETLPRRLHPSYSSPRLKYHYKLTVGAQRIGSPIHLLKMPIRVLALGLENRTTPTTNGEVEHQHSVFKGDDESRDESTPLDLALHRIETATCHRVPHSFNITSGSVGGGRRVARFSIFKTAYRLGEDVIGVFNFGEGTVPCVRYSVALQTEETLSERYSKAVGKPAVINVVNHGKCSECTLNTAHSQMVLTIPLTATPSFSNEIVSLEWKLHFRFVISSSPEQSEPMVYSRSEEAVQRVAPRELSVQVMTWDFPIKVVATHPAHVAKGFQMASIGSLNI